MISKEYAALLLSDTRRREQLKRLRESLALCLDPRSADVQATQHTPSYVPHSGSPPMTMASMISPSTPASSPTFSHGSFSASQSSISQTPASSSISSAAAPLSAFKISSPATSPYYSSSSSVGANDPRNRKAMLEQFAKISLTEKFVWSSPTFDLSQYLLFLT